MTTFQVRTCEAREALAALPRSAMKIHDGGAGAPASNSVPEANAVDYCVMFTWLERGADWLC
jgi:hypothetical protein